MNLPGFKPKRWWCRTLRATGCLLSAAAILAHVSFLAAAMDASAGAAPAIDAAFLCHSGDGGGPAMGDAAGPCPLCAFALAGSLLLPPAVAVFGAAPAVEDIVVAAPPVARTAGRRPGAFLPRGPPPRRPA